MGPIPWPYFLFTLNKLPDFKAKILLRHWLNRVYKKALTVPFPLLRIEPCMTLSADEARFECCVQVKSLS